MKIRKISSTAKNEHDNDFQEPVSDNIMNSEKEENSGINMSESSTANKGMNFSEKDSGEVASENDSSVSIPEINYEYGGSKITKGEKRLPIGKAVTFNITASGLDSKAKLDVVPEGESAPSKDVSAPITTSERKLKNGSNSVDLTGIASSAKGVRWELVALQDDEVISRSNPFVVTNYPYRVFRKTPELYSGALMYFTPLIFSTDAFDDPTSYSEAEAKEKTTPGTLPGVEIMEELKTTNKSGLFDPNSKFATFNVTDKVQLDPESIFLGMGDSNGIEGLDASKLAILKSAMGSMYTISLNDGFGYRFSGYDQDQKIYFSSDVGSISLSDKIEIPESRYDIEHTLVLKPGATQWEDRYVYMFQTSNNAGEGYSKVPGPFSYDFTDD